MRGVGGSHSYSSVGFISRHMKWFIMNTSPCLMLSDPPIPHPPTLTHIEYFPYECGDPAYMERSFHAHVMGWWWGVGGVVYPKLTLHLGKATQERKT